MLCTRWTLCTHCISCYECNYSKVAGVKNVIACSPPKEGVGAHPTIIYTADLCGADVILNLGGVPAIAAMTNGLFNNPPQILLLVLETNLLLKLKEFYLEKLVLTYLQVLLKLELLPMLKLIQK